MALIIITHTRKQTETLAIIRMSEKEKKKEKKT